MHSKITEWIKKRKKKLTQDTHNHHDDDADRTAKITMKLKWKEQRKKDYRSTMTTKSNAGCWLLLNKSPYFSVWCEYYFQCALNIALLFFSLCLFFKYWSCNSPSPDNVTSDIIEFNTWFLFCFTSCERHESFLPYTVPYGIGIQKRLSSIFLLLTERECLHTQKMKISFHGQIVHLFCILPSEQNWWWILNMTRSNSIIFKYFDNRRVQRVFYV